MTNRQHPYRALLIFLVISLCWPVHTFAAVPEPTTNGPRLPERDDEVLETLPQTLLDSRRSIQLMRRELAQRPDDAELAARVSKELIRLARASDDPRLFGHAHAAISRWWDDPAASTEILLIRAKLKETDHLYLDALTDLDLLLKRDPKNIQALVETANIALVVADFERARSAAASIESVAGPLQAVFAKAPVLARTGRASEAYDLYTRLLTILRKEMPGAVAWVETSQGEIAEMLGKLDQAETHYRAALAADPEDRYLLRAFADFLIDHDRPAEALMLLEKHTTDTGVLLACAISAKRSGNAELATRLTSELKARFDAIKLRQGTRHLRFESRYELELRGNPRQALVLAQQCWSEQKEPRDARNLLEAAIAANDPNAAKPVLEFIEKSRIQDVRLQKLVTRLETR